MKTAYTTKEVAKLLDIRESRVRSYARAADLGSRDGLVPGAGPWRFCFADLVVLRTAHALEADGHSVARICRVLDRAKAIIPDGLAGVRMKTEGGVIIATRDSFTWEPESGQAQLTLLGQDDEAEDGPNTVDIVGEPIMDAPAPKASRLGEIGTAHEWFDLASSYEESDPERAYEAYLRVLAADPEHVEAMINIGRLCSAAGERDRAAAYFRQAVRTEPTQPVAHFNLGVTLHDLGDIHGAIVSYRTALIHDTHFADAHYNLSTLLEEAGDQRGAQEHMNAYQVACQDFE